MIVKDLEFADDENIGRKIVFFVRTINAYLFATDYNLAKQVEFHGIEWLNINVLRKALNPEVAIGQYLDLQLVKTGKEHHQGVGYLSDGSMLVVSEAFDYIRQTVSAEVISILLFTGGEVMVFSTARAVY